MIKLMLFRSSLIVFLLAFLNSCENHKTFTAPAFPLIKALIAPVNLDSNFTCIRVADFVSNLALIDTIVADASLNVSFSKDKKDIYVKIIEATKVPPVSTLNIFSQGFCYGIVLKKMSTQSIENINNDSSESVNFNKNKQLHISPDNYNFSEIIISANTDVNNIIAIWQNQLLPANFISKKDNQFIINIPEVAEKAGISFMRIWASNKDGFSNDLIIPLKNGHVLVQSNQLNLSKNKSQINNNFLDRHLLENICSTLVDSNGSLKNINVILINSLDKSGWNCHVTDFIDAKIIVANIADAHCMMAKNTCNNNHSNCSNPLFLHENTKQLSILAAFLLTVPGMPVYAKGDKLQIADEYRSLVDVYNHLNKTKKEENAVKAKIDKLIELRKTNLALMCGDMQTLQASKNLLILYRTYFFEYAIVIINKGLLSQVASFKLPEKVHGMLPQAQFESTLNTVNDFISLEIPPYGIEVLTR